MPQNGCPILEIYEINPDQTHLTIKSSAASVGFDQRWDWTLQGGRSPGTGLCILAIEEPFWVP